MRTFAKPPPPSMSTWFMDDPKGHPYVKSPLDMACWDILGKVGINFKRECTWKGVPIFTMVSKKNFSLKFKIWVFIWVISHWRNFPNSKKWYVWKITKSFNFGNIHFCRFCGNSHKKIWWFRNLNDFQNTSIFWKFKVFMF